MKFVLVNYDAGMVAGLTNNPFFRGIGFPGIQVAGQIQIQRHAHKVWGNLENDRPEQAVNSSVGRNVG